jgi:hypothetical protein
MRHRKSRSHDIFDSPLTLSCGYPCRGRNHWGWEVSDSELTREEAEKIVQKVLDESAKVLGRDVAPDEQGASDIRIALEDLVQITYTTERDNFIDLEASGSEEAAQASGRGRFMPFFLASLRQYLCGDKEAAAKIQEAVKQAKAHSPNIAVPTSISLSAGGAAVVYVGVSSALAGTVLAAVAPPLVAGVALMIFLSGFDSFCEWSKPGGDECSSPEKTEDKTSSSSREDEKGRPDRSGDRPPRA